MDKIKAQIQILEEFKENSKNCLTEYSIRTLLDGYIQALKLTLENLEKKNEL